jgi:hypothetical protein
MLANDFGDCFVLLGALRPARPLNGHILGEHVLFPCACDAVSGTKSVLQKQSGTNTLKLTFGQDRNAIAQNVSLIHEVRCEHNDASISGIADDVPR